MFSRALLVAVLCVIAACSLPRVQAAVGLDISQEICASTNADTWKCLRNAGYSFAIIEGYQGGGRVNQNLARCVADARAAGFEYVDTYAWAAPNCPGVSGAEVANELMSYINANHVNVGMVWVDVEESGSCNPSVGANVDFYKSMTNQFVSAGWKTGVYSSPGEWGMTMGAADIASDLPLWAATYTYSCDFGALRMFGGWAKAAMMQYSDRGNACGISFDLSCY